MFTLWGGGGGGGGGGGVGGRLVRAKHSCSFGHNYLKLRKGDLVNCYLRYNFCS